MPEVLLQRIPNERGRGLPSTVETELTNRLTSIHFNSKLLKFPVCWISYIEAKRRAYHNPLYTPNNIAKIIGELCMRPNLTRRQNFTEFKHGAGLCTRFVKVHLSMLKNQDLPYFVLLDYRGWLGLSVSQKSFLNRETRFESTLGCICIWTKSILYCKFIWDVFVKQQRFLP